MITNFKPALAGIALAMSAATVAAPAAAQVNGIATASPEAVLVQADALRTGYQAISTAYATQRQQIATLRQEINNLQASLDTNGDREVNQAEWDANPTVTAQLEAKQQQAAQLLAPIALAEYYVVEQLLANLGPAQNQVVTANNIQIMLDPSAFQYAAEGVDVTGKILAALNASTPAVASTPPQDYQPRRETVAMHGAIQQIMVGAAQRAAIQQAQQQQQAQTAQEPGR